LDFSDYYILLGIPDLRFRASEADIRKAYRARVIEVHPDKLEQSQRNDEQFKELQRALDTLTDAKKRRAYDSKLAQALYPDLSEDEIPSAAAADSFYTVFSPLFDRVAIWSAQRPVLHLSTPPNFSGDDNKEYAYAQKFYDYWFSFRSWRDYSFELDNVDLDSAGSREEKRWMERQIERHNKKRGADAASVVRKLADSAFKLDPRIFKIREAERLQKEARRAAKEAEKRAAEEAEAQKQREAAEAAAKAEEERLSAKREKEFEQRALRKERKRLRDNVVGRSLPLSATVDDAMLEDICKSLSRLDLAAINDGLEAADNADGLQRLNALVLARVDRDAALQAEKEAQMRAEAQKAEEERRKREAEEADKPKWTKQQQSELEAALKKIPPNDPKRWDRVSNNVTGKSPAECEARFKEILEILRKKKEAAAKK
jgi:DnaJ family protein C protein 2